jgi:hypothetical protein
MPYWTVFVVLYMLACSQFLRGMLSLIGSELNASGGVSTPCNQTKLYSGLSVTCDKWQIEYRETQRGFFSAVPFPCLLISRSRPIPPFS